MTTEPRHKAPLLACDCHFHIFGPYDRFPLHAGRRYTPPPASVEEYSAMAARLGLQRHVIVQPSPYGTDNRVTLDAVGRLGRDQARAVVVIDEQVRDLELRGMAAEGAVGVRFNLVSGNGTPEDQLERLAHRLAPLGWHIQVYAEGEKLEALAPTLARLPVDVVIDHIGGVKAGLGTSHSQFDALLRLLDTGRAWVKLCHYRASSAGHPWEDVAPNVQALAHAAPERCVWGTDWPHPGMGPPAPEAASLLDQLFAWLPDPVTRHKVLVDNPAQLYRFGDAAC